MAFLDFLSGKVKCPNCGTKGAKKSGEGYKCPNPHCQWYDHALAPAGTTPKVTTVESRSGRSVSVSYRNFNGEVKTFNVDLESAVRGKNHWSVKVQPKGLRIVLSRDRVQNLNQVEESLPQRIAPGQALPTPRERQVLAYHKKYKTTSPLYEEIRAKYPNW